jgi:hypothetical protein
MQPGATIAADACGNDLLRVAANGSIETLAVFPSRSNSTRGIDSVPTSITVGPDGVYVGELASCSRTGESVARGSRRGADDLQERVHNGHRHHVRWRRQPLGARLRTGRSLAGPGGRPARAGREWSGRSGLGNDRLRRRRLRLELQHLPGDGSVSVRHGRIGRAHPRLTSFAPRARLHCASPGGVVQLVRTPACHAGGRGFESRRSRKSPANRHAALSSQTPNSG